MRVLILCLTSVLVAACAGRSSPDGDPAAAVAAAGDSSTEAETVEAGSLAGNEPACQRRPVTGSIIPQRVCTRNTDVEEVVDQEEIRDVLRGLERNQTTGELMRR